MNRFLFQARRGLSTSVAAYPFAKDAITSIAPPLPSTNLLKGTNLMTHLNKTMPTPLAQKMLSTLFSRRHPERLLPGSVLTVSLNQGAPPSFSGVLIAVRRRGPDTNFVLRNIINRTGVEMRFFVGSPAIKDIQVVQRAGGGGGKEGRRSRRSKLFYLRDDPAKMSAISAGVQKR